MMTAPQKSGASEMYAEMELEWKPGYRAGLAARDLLKVIQDTL